MNSVSPGKYRFICERQRLQRLSNRIEVYREPIGTGMSKSFTPFLTKSKGRPNTMSTLKLGIKGVNPLLLLQKRPHIEFQTPGNGQKTGFTILSKSQDCLFLLLIISTSHCLCFNPLFLYSKQQRANKPSSGGVNHPSVPFLWSKDHTPRHVCLSWLAGTDWNI